MTDGKQDLKKSNQPPSGDRGAVYEIKVTGALDSSWDQWFEGMNLLHVENGEVGRVCTLIVGPLADQPALHGLLAKIRDLNLTLISVRRVSLPGSAHQKETSMSTRKVRVAVNGYGVIGKRVADAVAAQDDMELIGVADVVSDWRVRVAVRKGYPLYASTAQSADEMRAAGLPVTGTLDDLLSQVDIIVDAAPKKIASANMDTYRKAGLKFIFQGGEKHDLTGHSFVAQANYASAIGRQTTRVVSCNTTSIVRTLGALHAAGLLKKARGVLVRRATDPWESHQGGIMNTVVPEKRIPSHQGPDAQTVVPELDVVTVAVAASHTNCHLHSWFVELTHPASRDEVLAAFHAAPRIAFLRAAQGLVALNSTIELMSDLGRPRGDMWEVGLWEDSLTVVGNELFYNYQVYNQAIVVPENIDAIRALTGTEQDAMASIAKTDYSLGLLRDFVEKNTSV